MRYRFLTILISFYSLFGCGHQDILTPQTIISLTEGEVQTELPPELWNTIAEKRERHLNKLLEIGLHVEGIPEQVAEETAQVEGIKALQEAYYNRYIDTDGIAIIGNEKVADKHFIRARQAILIMTSKHPQLRERLRFERGFYMILLAPPIELLPERYKAPYNPDDPEATTHILNRSPFFNIVWNGEIFYIAYTGRPSCNIGTGLTTSKVIGYCEGPLITNSNPDPGTHRPNLGIFVHEFTHALEIEMQRLDLNFQEEQLNAFLKATELDNFVTHYSRTNPSEHFAESTEAWFYDIGEGRKFETEEDFAKFNPILYELLRKWYPQTALPRHY